MKKAPAFKTFQETKAKAYHFYTTFKHIRNVHLNTEFEELQEYQTQKQHTYMDVLTNITLL